jgi:hypothetical protein
VATWRTITHRLLVTLFWGLVAYELVVLVMNALHRAPAAALISPTGLSIVLRWPFAALFLSILTGHILIPRRSWMPWPAPPSWGLPVVLVLVLGTMVVNFFGVTQPPPELCAIVGAPLGHLMWAQTPKELT